MTNFRGQSARGKSQTRGQGPGRGQRPGSGQGHTRGQTRGQGHTRGQTRGQGQQQGPGKSRGQAQGRGRGSGQESGRGRGQSQGRGQSEGRGQSRGQHPNHHNSNGGQSRGQQHHHGGRGGNASRGRGQSRGQGGTRGQYWGRGPASSSSSYSQPRYATPSEGASLPSPYRARPPFRPRFQTYTVRTTQGRATPTPVNITVNMTSPRQDPPPHHADMAPTPKPTVVTQQQQWPPSDNQVVGQPTALDPPPPYTPLPQPGGYQRPLPTYAAPPPFSFPPPPFPPPPTFDLNTDRAGFGPTHAGQRDDLQGGAADPGPRRDRQQSRGFDNKPMRGKKFHRMADDGDDDTFYNSASDLRDEGRDIADQRPKSSRRQDGYTRKREKAEKPHNYNTNPAQKTEPHNLQSLKVSFHFRNKCFADTSDVKQILETTLQTSTAGHSELDVQNIQLLQETGETLCDVIICSPDIHKSRRMVKNAVYSLIKKTALKINFVITNVVNTGGETDESDQKNRQSEANDEAMSERPVEKDSKKTKRAEGMDDNGNIPASVPQTLQFSVDKHFDAPDLLREYINLSVRDSPLKIQIFEKSISLTESKSTCLIKTESKADSKRLRKALLKAYAKDRIDLTFKTEEEILKEEKDTKAPHDFITQALSNVKVATDETLKRHFEKITFYKNELRSLNNEAEEWGQNPFYRSHLAATKGTIDRLYKQKSEFLYRCNLLRENFEKKEPGLVQKKDVASLMEDVGVECNRLGKGHAVYALRKTILQSIKSNQVCIVAGEAGSGKSSQLVQYLLEAGYAKRGLIALCHPRKSAAVCLSERVAREMVGKVGDVVGYKTSAVCKVKDARTRILYTTDEALLEDCLADPDLRKYSCVIVDDSHERSVYTDVLMGVIKRCLDKRPDLRVVILSSTGDQSKFLNYFKASRECQIPPFTFPVEVFHEEDGSNNFEDYEVKAVSKAVEIHLGDDSGDILVFLSTPLEVMRCCNDFEERCYGMTDFKCLALHSALPPEEMRKTFEIAPAGVRKIIFTTNYAGTSVALDGVKFVVDAGVVKERRFEPRKKVKVSVTRAISKACAVQRERLAGGRPEGQCHRLYSMEDFESLPETDSPEILRADLGRVVLKLVEANLDLSSFEFLQPPNEMSLASARETLVNFGAIEGNDVTVVGKWMSRLPYDVFNNHLIYKSKKHNLIYDAVVLATLVYYEGDIDMFFWPLSDSESEDLADCKSQLSSRHGDAFTSLNVFKMWSLVPKPDRAAWCRQNRVNYKSLGFLRLAIDDALDILRDKLESEIAKEFSDRESDTDILRKILFNTNIATVSHVHANDNYSCYKSLISQESFFVHPQSMLATTYHDYPEWIIFTDVFKTSEEYIKSISIVDEEWVQKAVKSDKITVDVSESNIPLVFHDEYGASAFRSIVGPCYSKFFELQEDLHGSPTVKSLVKVNRNLGTLDIYSNCPVDRLIVDRLYLIKDSVAEKLCLGEIELEVNTERAVDLNGMKVVIGQGGCVTRLVVPTQTSHVVLAHAPSDATVPDVLAKFKDLGEVVELNLADGKIVFGSVLEAFTAVEAATSEDADYSVYMPDTGVKHTPNVFQAKASWPKQPLGDDSKAIIKCSPLDRPVLVGKYLELSGNVCEINVSPDDDSDLVVSSIGSASEEKIKEKLCLELEAHGRRSVELEVFIATDSDQQKDAADSENKRQCLISFLKKHIKDEKYTIRTPFVDGNYHYVCFIEFEDPDQGQKVCHEMNRRYEIEGQEVQFSARSTCLIKVAKSVKDVMDEEFSTHFNTLSQTDEQLNIKWRYLENEDYNVIEVQCTKPEPIVEALDCLSKELDGKVINLTDNDQRKCLLNQWGQNRIETIQEITEAFVVTDFRKAKIHVYGSMSSVEHAVKEINSYISECEDAKKASFSLKSPGVIRLAFQTYGPCLEGIVEECGLKSARLDLLGGQSTLLAVGPALSLDELSRVLNALEEEAEEVKGQEEADQGYPTCSLCQLPTGEGQIYRLETCGHAHCLDCLAGLAQTTLNNNSLPFTCSRQQCRAEFVARDITFLLSDEFIFEADLVNCAVQAFVSANEDTFRLCPTANCPMVYEISHEPMGSEFVCPLCFVSVCTSCHKPFHRSMACKVSTGSSADVIGPSPTPGKGNEQSRQKLLSWMAKK